ncbi:MAG: hypothetical protein IAF58_16230 [Leptolyngbya sp.]|nr:hypothetical protein [Candidatus Melainabacteria bacterium]
MESSAGKNSPTQVSTEEEVEEQKHLEQLSYTRAAAAEAISKHTKLLKDLRVENIDLEPLLAKYKSHIEEKEHGTLSEFLNWANSDLNVKNLDELSAMIFALDACLDDFLKLIEETKEPAVLILNKISSVDSSILLWTKRASLAVTQDNSELAGQANRRVEEYVNELSELKEQLASHVAHKAGLDELYLFMLNKQRAVLDRLIELNGGE